MPEETADLNETLQQRGQTFLTRADACERDAAGAADDAVKFHLLKSAQQWRKLAADAFALAEGKRTFLPES